jgi:hypothetical protein
MTLESGAINFPTREQVFKSKTAGFSLPSWEQYLQRLHRVIMSAW